MHFVGTISIILNHMFKLGINWLTAVYLSIFAKLPHSYTKNDLSDM